MLEEYFTTNDEMLDLYTNAIIKAHGAHHPEVFDVRKIYQDIQNKAQHHNWDLANEFSSLRQVTHDYAIPNDVCGTFTKTYQMLEEFDHLVQA